MGGTFEKPDTDIRIDLADLPARLGPETVFVSHSPAMGVVMLASADQGNHFNVAFGRARMRSMIIDLETMGHLVVGLGQTRLSLHTKDDVPKIVFRVARGFLPDAANTRRAPGAGMNSVQRPQHLRTSRHADTPDALSPACPPTWSPSNDLVLSRMRVSISVFGLAAYTRGRRLPKPVVCWEPGGDRRQTMNGVRWRRATRCAR